MRYLILVLILTSCATSSDTLTVGSLSYQHTEIQIAGKEVANLASIIAAPNSIWNSPILKSAASSLLKLILGGK